MLKFADKHAKLAMTAIIVATLIVLLVLFKSIGFLPTVCLVGVGTYLWIRFGRK